MKLLCFKTLWGYQNSPVQAVDDALEQGFDGVEGPIPIDDNTRQEFAQMCARNNLHYIAEIATTGTYVADRNQSPQQQLQYLEEQLHMLESLQPMFVTCLGGCDAWPVSDSIDFFQSAMALANHYKIDISFETHRGRSLFNPWITRDIVAAIPDIKLTFDVSHWCVVCEGLQPSDQTLIQSLANNVHHIHARVGYDQGPQVPDPRLGVYQQELQEHLQWWSNIWQQQKHQNLSITTATPEFGPDGYEYRSPDGKQQLADLDDINQFMCASLKEQFELQFNGGLSKNRTAIV